MAHKARYTPTPANSLTAGGEPQVLTKQEFGRRLGKLMEKHGMNQSDLARAAGLGRDAVSCYIRGKSFPEPKNLAKIAQALQTTPQEILPNVTMYALESEIPALEIKQAVGVPDKMWIRVNQLVKTDQAMRILQILQEQ